MAIYVPEGHDKSTLIQVRKETGTPVSHVTLIKEILVEIPTEIVKRIYVDSINNKVVAEDKIVYVPKEVIVTQQIPLPYHLHKIKEINTKNKYIIASVIANVALTVGLLWSIYGQ